MMLKTVLVFVSLFAIQEIPFKPLDDFELKLDYKFKERPPAERHDYDAPNFEIKKAPTGPLPYLKTELVFARLQEGEQRVRIVNSNDVQVLNKKISAGETIKIDWGFTEDVKDRIVAHQYTVTFLNGDKKPLSRILLTLEEDGTLIVNDTKRGKL